MDLKKNSRNNQQLDGNNERSLMGLAKKFMKKELFNAKELSKN